MKKDTPVALDLSWMEEDPNWMNRNVPTPQRVTVRLGNGDVQHTYSRQHLERWMKECGGTIIGLGEDDSGES